MSIIESLIKAGESVSVESENHRAKVLLESTKNQNEVDALILNHSRPASEVAKLCEMTRPTFKEFAEEAMKSGVIDEVRKMGNQYKYTLTHIHSLMSHLENEGRLKNKSWQSRGQGAHIINIANLKGGTGKTTTAVSLAVSFALDLINRPRVLLIDLDPQGSQSQYANIDIENDLTILTSVDLMLGEQEPESIYTQLREMGHSHKDIVMNSLIETHIPNMQVLPAFPSDERFNQAAWEQFVQDKKTDDDAVMAHISLLKDKVINCIKDEFDFIIIDTAPQMNPLVWSALEASNGLLVPCTPHALDWTSTQSYIHSLPTFMENVLPTKGENLIWWKALATNFDDEHSRDIPILNRMKDALGSDLLNTQIKRSQAFEKATQNLRTVMDIRKKEELCSDKQLDKAVDSLGDVTREIIMHLRNIEVPND